MPIKCYTLHNARTVFGQIFGNVKHKSTLGLARNYKIFKAESTFFSFPYDPMHINVISVQNGLCQKWEAIMVEVGRRWVKYLEYIKHPLSDLPFWFPTNDMQENSSIGAANQPFLGLFTKLHCIGT